MGLQSFSVVGQSALISRGTILKNGEKLSCFPDSSLVRLGTFWMTLVNRIFSLDLQVTLLLDFNLVAIIICVCVCVCVCRYFCLSVNLSQLAFYVYTHPNARVSVNYFTYIHTYVQTQSYLLLCNKYKHTQIYLRSTHIYRYAYMHICMLGVIYSMRQWAYFPRINSSRLCLASFVSPF